MTIRINLISAKCCSISIIISIQFEILFDDYERKRQLLTLKVVKLFNGILNIAYNIEKGLKEEGNSKIKK